MIGFSFKWPQDTKTPKLVALTVNGIPYTCIEGGMYYIIILAFISRIMNILRVAKKLIGFVIFFDKHVLESLLQ